MMQKTTPNQTLLRTTALLVALIGVVGSLYFMFNAGRKQNSIVLLMLFTTWVLSPFVGLFLSIKSSGSWPMAARALVYWLTIVVSIASLVAYSGAFDTPETKNAFRFLVCPMLSWFIIVIVFLVARKRSDKNLKP